MRGRSCVASATLAALCGLASVSLVLHWDRAEVATSPLRVQLALSSMDLSGSQPSCQDQKSQGPDMDVWDVAKVPINWLSYGLINALASLWNDPAPARLDKHGNLGIYAPRITRTEDTIWMHGGWLGALQTYGIVLLLLVVVCAGFMEGEEGDEDCPQQCAGVFFRAFMSFAVYLAVIYGFVFLVMFLVYPIFAELEWFHMERAILFCIPLLDGKSTPISQYIIFPHMFYWLYLLSDLGKSKADFDKSTIHYKEPFKMACIPLPLTNGQASLGFAALHFVTDMWAFVVNLFHMPWLWSALWFVSLLDTCFIVWHVFNDEGRWRKITVRAKTAEDASQFILALISAVIAVMRDLKFDQYTIYAGIASLLGMLTSFKKWYVDAGVDEEQEAGQQLLHEKQEARERLTPGQHVRIIATGRCGELVTDDGSNMPYKVAFQDGLLPAADWFAQSAVSAETYSSP